MSIETVNVKKVMEIVRTMSDGEFAMIEEQLEQERQVRAESMAADFTAQLRNLFQTIESHGYELKIDDGTTIYRPSEADIEVCLIR